MAYIIVDELVNNHLFFLLNFLLGFLCTLGNLHALVLRLLELADGVIPTFALSSPNIGVCLSRLLGTQGVWTSFLSLTFTTSKVYHTHTLIYDIRYAIYYGNTKKNVVKMFKPWPVK